MKNQVGLAVALFLFFFALPQLPLHEAGTGRLFAVSWLVLATFVLASQLYQVVAKGVEELEKERKRKNLRRWKRTQRIERAHQRRRTSLKEIGGGE